jgi:protein gp37
MGALGSLSIEGRVPHWVIIGGESGVAIEKTRPTKPQWAREAIAECFRVGSAPFLKQWGRYANNPLVAEKGMNDREAAALDPVDNGKGGGLLDGRLYRNFPKSLGLAAAAA